MSERVDHVAAGLMRNGYCVVERALDPAVLADLERDLAPTFDATPYCQGDFYGAHTKRFGGLLSRSPVAASLVQHAHVLAIVERLLLPWCDRIALNLTQAVEIHPGALPQLPHRDQKPVGRGILSRFTNGNVDPSIYGRTLTD